MAEGWVCPVCSRVLAPWVAECLGDHTIKASSTNTQWKRSCCGNHDSTGCCAHLPPKPTNVSAKVKKGPRYVDHRSGKGSRAT